MDKFVIITSTKRKSESNVTHPSSISVNSSIPKPSTSSTSSSNDNVNVDDNGNDGIPPESQKLPKMQNVGFTIDGNEPNHGHESHGKTGKSQFTGVFTASGEKKFRYLNAKWYADYPWLHLDVHSGRLFCFYCVKARQNNLLITHKLAYEPTFIDHGFQDWKNAIRAFQRHAMCDCHREAVCAYSMASKPGIDAKLNAQIANDQHMASLALEVIVSSLLYLGKQGLAIRGHEETHSNFYQLLQLRSDDSKVLKEFLQKRKSFISPQIQNEILQIVAHETLRSIVKNIKNSKFYSIIVDGTTDQSTKEQVSICIRYVSDLVPIEAFIGLYEIADGTGEALSSIVIDALVRLDLPLMALRGQCYDGAHNMSGKIKGVKTRLQLIEPKAIYVHCFAHALNLSIQDAVRSVPMFRDILQCIHDLAVIVHGSAKRLEKFAEIAKGVDNSINSNIVTPRPICQTRWTVRFSAIDAALRSYPILIEYLSQVADMATVDDSSSKANGLLKQFEDGLTCFGMLSSHEVFALTDRLSCTLQSSSATVSGSTEAVQVTLLRLEAMRTDEHFTKLWSDAEAKIAEYSLNSIKLPRFVQPPRKYDYDGGTSRTAMSVSFSTPRDYYRIQYFAFLDSVMTHIRDRFDQPGIRVYNQVENLLIKACKGDDFSLEIADVCSFYNDISQNRLSLQLKMIASVFPSVLDVTTLIQQFRQKCPEVQSLFPEVKELLEVVLVVPASSATAERSFSLLRRLKTYLRSTTNQARLNHLAVITIHREEVEKIQNSDIKKIFVNANEYRQTIFGKV